MSDRQTDGLILYHGWTSSASRKVRFTLGEKGLAYDSRPVDIRRNEHHTPGYRRINPRGVVPALVHGEATLIESTFICEYLDDAFPDPPLRPAEPLARYQMRMWCRDVDERYLPAVQKHNWQATIHPIARAWSDAELEERLAAIPSAERRALWRRMAREPFTEAELEAAMQVLRGLVAEMEAALAGRPWLVGPALSLADIAVTPYVKRIEELEPTQLAAESSPRVADWWRRITARPAYRAANIGGYLEQAAPGYRPGA